MVTSGGTCRNGGAEKQPQSPAAVSCGLCPGLGGKELSGHLNVPWNRALFQTFGAGLVVPGRLVGRRPGRKQPSPHSGPVKVPVDALYSPTALTPLLPVHLSIRRAKWSLRKKSKLRHRQRLMSKSRSGKKAVAGCGDRPGVFSPALQADSGALCLTPSASSEPLWKVHHDPTIFFPVSIARVAFFCSDLTINSIRPNVVNFN